MYHCICVLSKSILVCIHHSDCLAFALPGLSEHHPRSYPRILCMNTALVYLFVQQQAYKTNISHIFQLGKHVDVFRQMLTVKRKLFELLDAVNSSYLGIGDPATCNHFCSYRSDFLAPAVTAR